MKRANNENNTPRSEKRLADIKICTIKTENYLISNFHIIILIFFLILPIFMIQIGWKTLDQCPINDLIPMFLFVIGIMIFIGDCLLIYLVLDEKMYRLNFMQYLIPLVIFVLLCLLILIMLIIDSVYVFEIHELIYDEHQFNNESIYCDKTLYLFSFWIVIIGYGTIVFLIIACAGCILSFCVEV